MNLTSDSQASAGLLVAELDVTSFVIEQMQYFMVDDLVVLNACSLLRNLSSYENLRKIIFKAGAVSALGSAVERHENHREIRDIARVVVNHIM